MDASYLLTRSTSELFSGSGLSPQRQWEEAEELLENDFKELSFLWQLHICFYKWMPSAIHLRPLTLSAQWMLQLWVPRSSHHGPGHWLPRQVGEDGAQDSLPGLGGKKAVAQEYTGAECENYSCLSQIVAMTWPERGPPTYLSLDQIALDTKSACLSFPIQMRGGHIPRHSPRSKWMKGHA